MLLSYIATFYKVQCLSQYLVHFSTYRVAFQARPCIFSTKPLNFFLHYSNHWSRPGSPPKEAFVAMGGSLVHCALSASVCLHLLTCVVFISSDLWSVMKFLIIWFLMVWFDQNLWLTDHKVAIKKKNSPNTVKLIQKVLPRKEIHDPVKRLVLSSEKQ